MKWLLTTLLFPILTYAQEGVTNFQRANSMPTVTVGCVYVDTITVSAKVRELGNRDIKFGIQQILEDELSEKYCIAESGNPVSLDVYFFGIPKSTIRIAGIESTQQITQIKVRIKYLDNKYEGCGESETEVRAVMIELVDNKVPFEKMTVSSALKKAIHEAVTRMP